MQAETSTSKRSLLQRIFISPYERRLRVGWRLLLHYVLFNALVLVAILIEHVLAGAGPSMLDPGIRPFSTGVQLIIMLLVTWYARRTFDKRSFSSLGLRQDKHALRDFLVGFIISAAMMTFLFVAHLAGGWAQVFGWSPDSSSGQLSLSNIAGSVLAFCFAAVTEEMLSRGYQMQNLSEDLGPAWGLFLSSALFSLMHAVNPHYDWKAILGLTASGLFLAYSWVQTSTLWLPIGLHLGWNLFEGIVYGFSVSGLELPGLVQLNVDGPAWLTGASFGPEAGLLLLPTLAFGAFLVRISTPRRARAAASPDETHESHHLGPPPRTA
jgi:membrane protease YdiL (CAAX protease family)